MSVSDSEPCQAQYDLEEFITDVLEELNIDEDDDKGKAYDKVHTYAHTYFSIDQADNGVWYARWKEHFERITFDSNDKEKLKNILKEYIALNMDTKP
jgi:hypothetical protein